MIVCVNCKREMKCAKTGVGVDFGRGHVYAGDRFECPQCGKHIVQCNRSAHYDPDHKFHDEYLEMPNPALQQLKELAQG